MRVLASAESSRQGVSMRPLGMPTATASEEKIGRPVMRERAAAFTPQGAFPSPRA